MVRAVAGFLVVALASACSGAPTAPSSLPSGALVGTVPQAGMPVPPRAGVTPPTALGATRFVAFGDSITWGAFSSWDPGLWFAASGGGYPERLVMALNTHHAPQVFTVANEGLPGEQAIDALSRFRLVLANRRPEVVLLLEGINDLSGGVSPSRIGNGLGQLLDAAATANVPVVLGTMYQTYAVVRPDGEYRANGADQVPALNDEIRLRASSRLNVHLLDLYPLMLDRALVGNDGLHLTDAGFQVMTSAFLDAIERAFPVRGSFQ